MSLTAQTISTFLAAFALCVAVQVPQRSNQFPKPPKTQGNSTIRGVVTYADTGRPVRYAGLRVFEDKTGGWSSESVTNRRGEFVVQHVPAGRYIVFVESPGILKPAVSSGSGSALARLRLSGETFTEALVNGTDSVDVKVQAVRGGVITGRVVTEDDQPLANADIKLLKRENGKWEPALGSWNRYWSGNRYSDNKIKTDPSGIYRIAGLVAGEYLVRVSEGEAGSDQKSQPEDGAYTNGFFMAAYYPAATTIKDAQAVTVIEGSESTGVDIRMPERPAYTMSGTVKFGPDDEPAAFVEVVVERADEVGYSDGGSGSTSARADGDGKWEVKALPAGEYSVSFGGSVQVGPPDATSSRAVAPKRISVRVENGDLVVPETKLSEGSIISGRLTWDGKPPKNYYKFQVRAMPVTPLSGAADSTAAPTSGAAPRGFLGALRPDGEFLIVGVTAGKYSIKVSSIGEDAYYFKSMTRKGGDLTQSPLKVREDSVVEDVVIALSSEFATVEGQLTPPESSPKLDLQNVVVVLAPANDATRRLNPGLIAVQPDARGTFVVNCAPGEYVLTAVTAADIKKRSKPISEDDFKQDNQKSERVKLKAGEKLKGLTVPVGTN